MRPLGDSLLCELSKRLNPDDPRKDVKKTAALEAAGVFVWLKRIFPFAFEEDFSEDHRRFWILFFSVLMRIRKQRELLSFGLPIPDQFKIEDKEYVILLILGRALGKSATIEASAVMRGAVLGGGYCLYLCESQDQSDEHIQNCKALINHPESRLLEYYPEMEILEGVTIQGIKTKDRQDLFITSSGWICRSKGLNAKLRGIRLGTRRPDDINIDDVDDVGDSPAVSLNKLKKITASVIPTQARKFVTIKFGQNLIAENSVMNQIFSGKQDALAERTTIGVSNTFIKFEYQTYLDETDGRIRHKILPTSISSWSGVDIAAAQKFLNDSGLETFLAEYQNQFDHLKTGKVFHEFNERRHLITWSQFEQLFGTRHIPAHWGAKAAADIGYSKESLSAWIFTATSAQNSALPSHYFAYRGLTFEQEGIDFQAETIWEHLFPNEESGKEHFEASQTFGDYPELYRILNTKPRLRSFLKNYEYNASTNSYELPMPVALESKTLEDKALYYVREAEKTFRSQVGMWLISHEKTGEQKTLGMKYGLPVHKTKDFKVDSGVSEANHLLRGDYTRPHPFRDDEEMILGEDGKPNGKYKYGCPFIFFIVDDEQIVKAIDDRGMKIFREHLSNQRWTLEALGKEGLSRTIPMKYQSDAGDAFRMYAADYHIPAAAELTQQEEFTQKLPEKVKVTRTKKIDIADQMAIMMMEEKTKLEMLIQTGDATDEQIEAFFRMN